MKEWEISIGHPYVDEHISMDRYLAAKSRKSVFSGVSGYISSQDGLSSGLTSGTQTQSPGRGTSAPFRAKISYRGGRVIQRACGKSFRDNRKKPCSERDLRSPDVEIPSDRQQAARGHSRVGWTHSGLSS